MLKSLWSMYRSINSDPFGFNMLTKDLPSAPMGPSRSSLEWMESRLLFASIGDTVFHDLNANGTYDSGEPGLMSVKVDLYRDINANSRLDERDIYKQSTVTNDQGQYNFTGLAAGDYLVRVADDGAIPGFVAQVNQAQGGIDPNVPQMLKTLMSNRKDYFVQLIDSSFDPDLSISNPYVLYDIQSFTNNILRYAGETRDVQMLSEISDIYLRAYDELLQRSTYAYSYWPGSPTLSEHALETSAKMWVGDPAAQNPAYPIESVLVSSQFTYAVANLINYILDVPSGQRTASMNDVVSDYVSVILTDHYDRWLFADQGMFQTTGWGGPSGLYNHSEHLQNVFNRFYSSQVGSPVSYLDSISDMDLWIIAGVTEMLGANAKDPTAVPISSPKKQQLLDYVKLANRLIASRMTESDLTNFQGQRVKGVNLDLGIWKDHSEYAYTGYTGASSPQGQSAQPVENVGWDVSHARRLVQFFDTMYRHRAVTGSTMVDDQLMSRVANQLVYGAFNKDLDEPLITNFMDGTNGWYRVSGGFAGYGPYDLTNALLTGGYGYWGRFHPDVKQVIGNLWADIDSIYMKDDSPNGVDILTDAAWTAISSQNGATGHVVLDSTTYVDAGALKSLATSRGAIELWFKPSQASTTEDLVNIFENSYYDYLLVRRNSNNTMSLYIEDDDEARTSITTSATITVGQWNHLVISHDGSSAKIYVNGSESSVTGTNSAYWVSHLNANDAWFGKSQWNKYIGGLDGIRLHNGPLTAAEVLRRYQRDSLVAAWSFDEVDEGKLIWNASLVSDGKVGGAANFDGVDDYFRAYPDVALSSSTGTIECWFNPDQSNDNDDLVYISETTYADYLLVRRNANGTINVLIENNDTAIVNLTTSATINVGQWNHLAVTQDGSGVKIYVNGVLSSTSGTNSSSTWTSHLTITAVNVGNASWGHYFDGKMDDLRIFSRALSAAEVKVRHSGEGVLGSWDFQNQGDQTHIWNAAFTKSGKIGDGAQFDGADDYVRITPSQAYATAQGTIEFWFKPDQANSDDDLVYLSETSYADYLLIRRNANGTISVIIENNDVTLVNLTSSATVGIGQWNHLAVTQDGTGVKVHLNGVQSSTTGTNSSTTWASHLSISSIHVGNASWGHYFGGTVDELRFYDRALSSIEADQHRSREQRVADWQFNRQPSASTLDFIQENYGTDLGKTDGIDLLQFLPTFTRMLPTIGVTVSSAQTVTSADLALVRHDGTTPHAMPDEYYIKNASWTSTGRQGGAMAFDGVDDYIRTTPSPSYSTSQGAIEFWFKPDQSNNNDDLVYISETSYADFMLIRRNANGTINVIIEDNDVALVDLTSLATVDVGQWNHLAITQDGNGVKIYLNGTQSSVTGTNSTTTWTSHLNITSINVGSASWGYYLGGSLDELRFYNQPLTSQAILEHRNGADRSQPGLTGSWRFDVQSDPAITVSGSQLVREGRRGGARWFDGVDDSLNAGTDNSLKSSNGAIELWVQPTEASRQEDIVHIYENSANDYFLIRRESDDRLRVIIRDNGTSLVDVYSTSKVSAGSWNHIIVTQDGAGVRIHLNGAQSSITGTNSNTAWTNHLTINGAYFGRSGLSSFMKGRIDDIRVYNTGISSTLATQLFYGVAWNAPTPVRRWGFDILADSYTSNNTAWISTGQHGGAAGFDGVDDYFNGGALTDLATSKGTLDLWIKPTATSRVEELLTVYENTTNDYLLVRRESDNRIRVIIRDNGSNLVNIVTTATVTNGQWNHLAIAQGGAGVKIYINGVAASISGTNSNTAWMNHLAIAGTYFGKAHSGNTYTGAMDRVQYFNRALTANEVSQHFEGKYNSRQGLLRYWDFEYQAGFY